MPLRRSEAGSPSTIMVITIDATVVSTLSITSHLKNQLATSRRNKDFCAADLSQSDQRLTCCKSLARMPEKGRGRTISQDVYQPFGRLKNSQITIRFARGKAQCREEGG